MFKQEESKGVASHSPSITTVDHSKLPLNSPSQQLSQKPRQRAICFASVKVIHLQIINFPVISPRCRTFFTINYHVKPT